MASPGLPATLLCEAGSALLIVSAAIHLHLWSNGYDQIPTIGLLFLVQGIAGIVVALLVAISRHFLVALAGALFAAGTIGGLLVSVEFGLFGFQDSLSAPYATMSLVVEAAAFVVMLAAGYIGMRRAGWVVHRPAPGRDTDRSTDTIGTAPTPTGVAGPATAPGAPRSPGASADEQGPAAQSR